MSAKAAAASNTTIRNNRLFCLNCGGSEPLSFPMVTEEFSKKITAFKNNHQNCEKTWKEPIVNMELPEKERAEWWAQNGERGLSSESIFCFMMEGFATGSYPHDLDDFRRCYALLQVVPEWKPRMKEMKIVNKVWKRLAENWDKLTELFEQAKEGNEAAASEMYNLMKSFGC